MSQKQKDLASRALWTALEVVLGFVTVEALNIPVAWVPVVATALSAVKSFVASKVGNPDTVVFDK